ncbi:MAG: hypothetical protein C0399_03360 [Syntrophus sp. (in: bacteria)]|nr:hypothetical protein [Syntrophus sp. (in: bacteria)]
MTKYQRDFLSKLKDHDAWPALQRGDFLQNLNDFADSAAATHATEGYLAAFLVYQQLVEEMVNVLVDCSTFLIQCRVFPLEYRGTKQSRKKMFGQLLIEFEAGIMDAHTSTLLSKCRTLNDLRIRMIHKITRKESLTDITRRASHAKRLFDEIFELYDHIYEDFRSSFKDHKKDIAELEEMLEET